jgi:hypothetical protein
MFCVHALSWKNQPTLYLYVMGAWYVLESPNLPFDL